MQKQLTKKQGKFHLGVQAHTPHLPGSSAVPVFIKKKLLTADALHSRGAKIVIFVSSVAANTDVTPAETGLQVGQQKPIYTLPGLCRCVSLCGVHM